MKRLPVGFLVFMVVLAAACDKREPLTAEKATALVEAAAFKREPVYAEVPQRVWWNAGAPQDEYDLKALRTLKNLEQRGFVTVTDTSRDGTASFEARVTEKGFRIIGTAPSARGPALRAQICWKVYDGVRNFQRHPSEETVGTAELRWRYTDPTPLYDAFETKIDKPLEKPFATILSFRYEEHQWKFSVVVPKTAGRP